jgi:hypothetical protein
MIFCDEYRDKVKKENPNLSNGQIKLLLSKKWKQLTDNNLFGV